MEDIVFEDTGNHLQWRHIHGSQMNDYDGKILQWAGDQHSGQAKGSYLMYSDIFYSMEESRTGAPSSTIIACVPRENGSS